MSVARRVLNKRLLVACLDSTSIVSSATPSIGSIGYGGYWNASSSSGRAGSLAGGRPDMTFSRQLSIIPSSWGFGNESKKKEEDGNEETLSVDDQGMDQLTHSAATTGVDDLVNLAQQQPER